MPEDELFYSALEAEHPDGELFLGFVDSLPPDQNPDFAIATWLEDNPECTVPHAWLRWVYKTAHENEESASSAWFQLEAYGEQVMWEKEVIEREILGNGVFPPEIDALALLRYEQALRTTEERQALNKALTQIGLRRLLAGEFEPTSDDSDTSHDEPPTDPRLRTARSPAGARLTQRPARHALSSSLQVEDGRGFPTYQ